MIKSISTSIFRSNIPLTKQVVRSFRKEAFGETPRPSNYFHEHPKFPKIKEQRKWRWICFSAGCALSIFYLWMLTPSLLIANKSKKRHEKLWLDAERKEREKLIASGQQVPKNIIVYPSID